jgi:segregation and condensation protein B
MARKQPVDPPQPRPGFSSQPADGGLSIDRLAQAFAAMMGGGEAATAAADTVVRVDASPDLDEAEAATDDDTPCPVTPLSILEAVLFVGQPGGRPVSSGTVAGLIRGVPPEEVDELAAELQRRCLAENRPYEVVFVEAGWIMRLRPEFARFGSVLEGRAKLLRLDAEALDVLALVAWNQPVPRDRLVELGCDARPAVLRQLVRRGLLELDKPAAEGDSPLYRTTPKFLELFRLESLADLPDPTAPPA